jgi:hypothetical protein
MSGSNSGFSVNMFVQRAGAGSTQTLHLSSTQQKATHKFNERVGSFGGQHHSDLEKIRSEKEAGKAIWAEHGKKSPLQASSS